MVILFEETYFVGFPHKSEEKICVRYSYDLINGSTKDLL